MVVDVLKVLIYSRQDAYVHLISEAKDVNINAQHSIPDLIVQNRKLVYQIPAKMKKPVM